MPILIFEGVLWPGVSMQKGEYSLTSSSLFSFAAARARRIDRRRWTEDGVVLLEEGKGEFML